MDTTKQYELSDYATQLIHHKSRQLVGTAGFTRDDIEDIQQDLTLDLLERLPRFDPAKAKYNTFVARVIERKISKLIRHRKRQRRDYRRDACSLNAAINDDGGGTVERIKTISQDEHDLRAGKYARPAEERADLHMDIEAVLSDQPQELRQAGQMLMTMPIAEVAHKLSVPRSTFYETHIAKLREVFEAKGLGEYIL